MGTRSNSGGQYGSHSWRLVISVFTFLVSPKSHSLIREKSDLKINMLSNFTSLCTNSLLWRCSRAAPNCLATLFVCNSPMPVSDTLDVKSPILIYSN